jgi:hypothetical protein
VDCEERDGERHNGVIVNDNLEVVILALRECVLNGFSFM